MRRICFIIMISTVKMLAAQEAKFTVAAEKWNSDSLGNQRAVIKINSSAKVAKVIVPWRRRDNNPQDKRIIIEDAQTHNKVLNVKTGNINHGYGEIYFEPVSGKGIYYAYYMPYRNEGRSNYPKGIYLKPEQTASENWLQTVDTKMKATVAVMEIQCVDSFNITYPMEVIATKKETLAIVEKNKNKDYIVFPEDRIRPVVMRNYLPYKWIEKGVENTFKGAAAKGENYSFQLGIYTLKTIKDVILSFTDLKSANGNTIPVENINCLNNTGVKYDGSSFYNKVTIPVNTVQAMWCLVDIPQKMPAGIYKGKAIINSSSAPSTINIQLTITNNVLADGGISEPWKQTRLKWLNSTMAQKNTVIAPYTPLKVENNTVSLLGRKIEVNDDGFPKQVQTFFTSEMTGYKDSPNNIITQPISFHFTTEDGTEMKLHNQGLNFTQKLEGTVMWKATSTNDTLQMEVAASLEFDGFISYSVKLKALQNVSFKDISMQIPFNNKAAKYMMGMGEKGGYRKEGFEWKWDVAHKNQDGAWIGNVNAGLQYSLRDEKYVRPLNTNFYLQKPLLLPASWGNNNKGGISIGEKGNAVLVNNYSGAHNMKKGDTLYYNFTFLITPFHTINTNFQWANRFYHKYNDIDSIKATGASVINIHHATPINPWINYPFIEWRKMKAYIDEAHAKGLKVKIYNTVRELSDHAYETFPMRSLGHEIYSTGNGGGFSWLQEHIDSDYIAAWFVPEIKDAAIVNSGMSRWHNYYVEGMNWLAQHVGIDGIYLDDVAFDRTTMKRVKRVLTLDGHPGIIDLHSANQYNKNDGFNNSANLYMEHFPYLNRLWFGEYFDYERNSPDFFLTEVSGIPFGLMGEMLEKGGNLWRGMIYGMTNRMPWSENADPRPIWKVWDDFGMKDTKMIGYWSDNCPVKTSNSKVLATVYKKDGAALVSIASWADEDTTIQLQIDWKQLGIDSSKATITAPEIKNFQPAKIMKETDGLPVQKGKGWLLIIE